MTTHQPPLRKTIQIKPKRWSAYAVAGAATVFGAASAEGEITHVVVADGEINQNVAGLQFSADDVGPLLSFRQDTADFGPSDFASMAQLRVVNGSFIYGANPTDVANLGSDAEITIQTDFTSNSGDYGGLASSSFYLGDRNVSGNFLNRGGFVGFRFDIGDGTQHGWARLSSGATPATFVLEEFAFATAGQSIRTGQVSAVPEPSTLGLLALGAVGLVASRRRRSS